MEAPAEAQQPQAGQPSAPRKKMTKQLTGKRDDTPLHSAARAGNIAVATDILTGTGEDELKQLLAKQNQSGETALYVAAEYGYVDLVREMIKYYDLVDAGIKARNGFDAFHIAAKQGDLGTYFNFIPLLFSSMCVCVLFFGFKPRPLCRRVESTYGGSPRTGHDRRRIEHHSSTHGCDARPHRDSEVLNGNRKQFGHHC